MKSIKLTLAFLLILVFSINANDGSTSKEEFQHFKSRSSAFYPDPASIPLYNITIGQNPQTGWAQWGNPCAGCASYFFQINRSQQAYQAEDGKWYYFYYFLFFSNSYYSDGTPASTYLKDLLFYADGHLVVQGQYLLVEPGRYKLGAWIRSFNPNANVSFQISQMNVY